MNLKKVSGGSKAKDIDYYAEKDSDEILREIQIIDPDIIIACGNDVYTLLADLIFDMDLKEVMKQKIELSDKMKNYGHYIEVTDKLNKKKTSYLVHYRHPAQYGTSGNLKTHYANMQIISSYLDDF